MKRAMAILAVLYCGFLAVTVSGQTSGDGPRYVNGNNLVRPTNYREWIFLGSSIGMTYTPPRAQNAAPNFANVFVNPSSYRAFMQTGQWPDQTIFVLEPRRSSTESSLVKDGRFQSDMTGLEAEVKDARFADGWAWFNFGLAASLRESVAAIDQHAPQGTGQESCLSCHTAHGAVEKSFVQFYPTLLEVAKQKGTVKASY
jgi:hypothetical protein